MGAYVKLGQVICHMESVIPDAFVKELEPLCSECPTSNIEEVKRLLEKEYGKDLSLIFKEIEPEPIGSASLAQVHRGVLVDGTKIAIKVQHAKVPYHLKGDIMTVKVGCYLAELIFPDFRYKWLGTELGINLPNELDFIKEAKNADRCRELFKNEPRLVIPKVFWDLTTDKVMVMSFEEGKCITDTKYLRDNHIKLKEVSGTMCEVFNQMIFKHGFVHADPHQGNLLVRKEKINGIEMTRIVLLDHGLYLTYDDDFRYQMALLWRGVITQNKTILRDACQRIGIKQDEMFIHLLTSNEYTEVMDEDKKFSEDRLKAKSIFYLI
jgi:aarF domain-containing kinase